MSMLQEFFEFLADLFQQSGGELDPETVRQRLIDEGYEDVTAYDVQEAVRLMCEEGDVFSPQQASFLEAYTGGNNVDQSFNAGDIGRVTTGSPSNTGGSPSPGYTAPPPPPMDPAEGYTDLDAAVQQIVYVSNVTNNTTVNDQDTFEDNDIVTDASVNQNILAGGDVNQDFDNAIAGEDGFANTGEINAPVAQGGGDANQAVGNASIATGDGDAVSNIGGQVTTGGGDNIVNVAGQVETGEGDLNNIVDNDGSLVETGEGDQQAIIGSAVGSASFGEGDSSNEIEITSQVIDDSIVNESSLQVGEENESELTSNDELDLAEVTVEDASQSDITGIDNISEEGSALALTADATGTSDETEMVEETAGA
jgi:hypothetical protein